MRSVVGMIQRYRKDGLHTFFLKSDRKIVTVLEYSSTSSTCSDCDCSEEDSHSSSGEYCSCASNKLSNKRSKKLRKQKTKAFRYLKSIVNVLAIDSKPRRNQWDETEEESTQWTKESSTLHLAYVYSDNLYLSIQSPHSQLHLDVLQYTLYKIKWLLSKDGSSNVILNLPFIGNQCNFVRILVPFNVPHFTGVKVTNG
ncbi:hypothetical protein WN51_06729 [Melipona quadrifasciata]|uniref:Uncharacterized protein n=1 Tax=Melipona quadrifasciata TaxID=166423 RepID=A0A0N0U3J4_9HYME|nr:hypothetical protein WN51_06729 [Melipona quadrifasciata]